MNKRLLNKIAISSDTGKLRRSPTALAILTAAGPMSDKALARDMERLDSTIADPLKAESKASVSDAAVNRTQLLLYRLRRSGQVQKRKSGDWYAIRKVKFA